MQTYYIVKVHTYVVCCTYSCMYVGTKERAFYASLYPMNGWLDDGMSERRGEWRRYLVPLPTYVHMFMYSTLHICEIVGMNSVWVVRILTYIHHIRVASVRFSFRSWYTLLDELLFDNTRAIYINLNFVRWEVRERERNGYVR